MTPTNQGILLLVFTSDHDPDKPGLAPVNFSPWAVTPTIQDMLLLVSYQGIMTPTNQDLLLLVCYPGIRTPTNKCVSQ